jgi:biotin carboxylase
MKKIMILGAGIYQVPLIKKAKEKGIYTIVASIPGDYPGFIIADKVYYTNTVDEDAILSLARKENIDGIMTTGTDVAVRTIGHVCDKMKLAGVSEKTAVLTTDKAKMKECFYRSGVRTADFKVVHNLEEVYKACENLQFPVIFKCVDKSGSRGIKKVLCESEIRQTFIFSKSYSNKDYIVIEKYLEGYEIGLDGYVDEKQGLLLPHEKINYFNGFTCVPRGHIFPYQCDKELYRDIINQAQKAISALGLNKCFFNMDIMIVDNKAFIIEVGARTGATCIPELISEYCGFDIYDKMIDCALGKTIDVSYKDTTPCVAELLISDRDGIIKGYDCESINNPNVKQIHMDYAIGDTVREFKVGPDRIGNIVVCGQSVEEAISLLEKTKKDINLEIR